MAEQITVLAEAELRIKHADAINRLAGIDRAMQKNAQSSRNFKNRVQRDYNLASVRSLAVEDLQKIEAQLNKNNQATRKAGGATRNLGTQFAYLASDAGYLLQNPRMGLMAIGNNLSQITISMQYAKDEAKRLGTTVRAEMKKTLLSGGGFLIAINLLIALITQLPTILKKWGSEQDKVNDAIRKGTLSAQDQVVKMQILQKRLNDSTNTLRDRHKILMQLEKMGVKTKGPDGKWIDNLDEVNAKIEKNIKLVKLRAEARAIEEIIVQKTKEKIEAMDVKFWGALWSSIKQQTGFGGGIASDIVKVIGEADDEIKALTESLFKIFDKIDDLDDTDVGLGSFFEKELMRLKDANKAIDDQLKQDAESNIQTMDRHHEEYLEKLRERLSQSEISQKEYNQLEDEANRVHEGNKLRLLDENNKAIIAKNASFYETQRAITLFQRKVELEDLIEWYDEKGATVDEKEAAIAALKKRWRKTDVDEQWGQAQRGLQITGDALHKAAQLNEKNKGLAKASIIANAAAASIGIWRDYHGEKNTINAPFNTIAAGVVQAGLVASTISALNSLNSNSAPGGSGAGATRPHFNVIGNTESNQLAEVVASREEKPVKAYVVAGEVDSVQELERNAEMQATI